MHQDFHWLIIATKLLTAKLHSLYVKESESGVRVGHFWNVVVGVGVGYSTSNSGTLVDSEVFWILCCRTGLTGWWDKQFVQRKEKFVYLKIVEQLRRFPSLSLKSCAWTSRRIFLMLLSLEVTTHGHCLICDPSPSPLRIRQSKDVQNTQCYDTAICTRQYVRLITALKLIILDKFWFYPWALCFRERKAGIRKL